MNIISRVSAPDLIGFSVMGFHADRIINLITRERRPAQAFQSRTEQFRRGIKQGFTLTGYSKILVFEDFILMGTHKGSKFMRFCENEEDKNHTYVGQTGSKSLPILPTWHSNRLAKPCSIGELFVSVCDWGELWAAQGP